jgi:L-ascorbate metabolism protein UlaG (beta-lactamase superfamily)
LRLFVYHYFELQLSREKSDHFDGRRFVNPTSSANPSFAALVRMLLEPRTQWPTRIDQPMQKVPSLDGEAAIVTFIGHSTFLIQTAAGNILTDPMYSERASPVSMVGPRRVRQPAIAFDDLPSISTVVLSHNHYDHCDRPTLRMLAERFDPLVVTPLGNGALVRSSGIRQVEELDWWQESKNSAMPITLTPAQHFSARGPLDRNRALWGGFVIAVDGARIYFAGDTAYANFFLEVKIKLGPIRLALLPIGAYEPRWFMQSFHMNPAEAVQAHLDLEARESVGMHFGTFQLTTESIDEPLLALDEACRTKNIPRSRFKTLGFGKSVRLDNR